SQNSSAYAMGYSEERQQRLSSETPIRNSKSKLLRQARTTRTHFFAPLRSFTGSARKECYQNFSLAMTSPTASHWTSGNSRTPCFRSETTPSSFEKCTI